MRGGKTLLVLQTILSAEIKELNVNILMGALKTCADFVQMAILMAAIVPLHARNALIWANSIEQNDPVRNF